MRRNDFDILLFTQLAEMEYTKLTPLPLLQGLLAGSVLVQTVVYATLGLRFWCRRLTTAAVGWDDWLACASTAGGTAMLICVGLCKHPRWTALFVAFPLADRPSKLLSHDRRTRIHAARHRRGQCPGELQVHQAG